MKKIINLIAIAAIFLTAGCLTTTSATGAVVEESGSSIVVAGEIPFGIVRLHYSRMDQDYTDWGLHIWGEGYLGDAVDWGAAVEPTGITEYGAYWDIEYAGDSDLNFIIHRGDEKDPDGDRSFFDLDTTNEFWAVSGDSELYTSEAEAQ